LFENIKADHELKLDQLKTDNPFCFKNMSIVNLTTQSARNSFNRYIQRGNKVSENNDPYSLQIPSPPVDGTLVQNDIFFNSFQDKFSNAFREFSMINTKTKTPTTEDEQKLLKSERKPRKNLVSLKIDFLSKVSSPKKSPQIVQAEALEDAKFFAQIQSEKDRKTIQIRLAQLTKQYDKKYAKPTTDRKTNRTSANVLLKKSLVKKFDFVSNQASSIEIQESTRVVLPLDKSVMQSRRYSQNTISSQEFYSLYNQKLLKGRVSTRAVSPVNVPVVENNEILKSQRFNELATKEFTSLQKNDIMYHRKMSATETSHFNEFKPLPPSEKERIIKTFNDLGDQKSNNLDEDIPKKFMKLPVIRDQEKNTGYEEKCGLTMDILKKKNSLPVNTSIVKGKKSGDNSKENSIYAHLHEAKKWRMKVFQKPQRRCGLMNSLNFAQKQKVVESIKKE